MQIWATWLFYGVLVDLGDTVADQLSLPFDEISLEMIYLGLDHSTMAHQKGKATDPVKYFTDPQNRDLGIIKQKPKPNFKSIVAPFPDLQSGTDQFFPIFMQKPLDTRLSGLTCHKCIRIRSSGVRRIRK